MSAPPQHSGFTETTEVPLFWTSYGDASSDRVLILHGGPGAHHDYLLPQMLVLAKRRQVILYDQRGGGQSRDDSRAPITWQTHVADLVAVLAELDLQTTPIIGYSWGGLLAMLHAIHRLSIPQHGNPHPPLVLIDPAPAASSFRREMEVEFSARQNSDWVRLEREKLRSSGLQEQDPPAYKQRLFELSVSGYFQSPERARDLTPFRVVGRIQESVWKSLGDYDLVPDLRRLQVPSLVVHGRDDPIPVQSSIVVAEALRARLLLLEKCGHVPYVEQPIALFSAIETFLDEYQAQKPE